jgi:hypothetical protein
MRRCKFDVRAFIGRPNPAAVRASSATPANVVTVHPQQPPQDETLRGAVRDFVRQLSGGAPPRHTPGPSASTTPAAVTLSSYDGEDIDRHVQLANTARPHAGAPAPPLRTEALTAAAPAAPSRTGSLTVAAPAPPPPPPPAVTVQGSDERV